MSEDLKPSGDITTKFIKNNKKIKAKIISNQNCVVGGLDFVKLTPPIIQFWFEIILALIFLLFLIRAVVISPEGFKSSDIACFTSFFLVTFNDYDL